jgi:hypothetical protein
MIPITIVYKVMLCEVSNLILFYNDKDKKIFSHSEQNRASGKKPPNTTYRGEA